MPDYTSNINLAKPNTSTEGKNTFNLKTYLNDNWDLIDRIIGALSLLNTDTKSSLIEAVNELCTKKAPLANPIFTGVAQAPQLKSTVASGTAPLLVTSPTVVTNLNADMVDGYNATDFIINKGSTASNVDLNTILTQGVYKLSGSTCTNYPSDLTAVSAEHSILEVFVIGIAILQRLTTINTLAYDSYADCTYTRVSLNTGSSWSAWKKHSNIDPSTGILTTPKIKITGNNTPSLWIGDDAVLGDCDVAHMIGIRSQTDATQGGIVFGSGNDTKIWRDSASVLRTNGAFVTGDVIKCDSTGDAKVELFSSAIASTKFRDKIIYSSPNIGNGDSWGFRAIRSSDGLYCDFTLDPNTSITVNSAYKICTTYNEPSQIALSGYKKFADGTILQWGYAASQASGATITFPITFPNNIWTVNVTPNNSVSTTVGANTLSTSSFKLYTSATQGVYWQAIGY